MASAASSEREGIGVPTQISHEKCNFVDAKMHWQYKDQDMTFQVVSVHRCCILERKPEVIPSDSQQPLEKPTVIYLPRITLTRAVSCFYDIYLHSKYDSLIAANVLNPGSVICIKEYVVRGPPTRDVEFRYVEILDLEMKPLDSTCVYHYNKWTLADFVKNLEFERLPIRGMIKLRPWFDMSPFWRQDNGYALESSLTECDSSSVAMDKLTNIAAVAEDWATTPMKPMPLMVRVLKKTKIAFYIPTLETKDFPTRSMYDVADMSGSCVLTMWDYANERSFYTKIHVGSVLLIQEYHTKRGVELRFPTKRSSPKKFQLDLLVEGYLPCKVPTKREDVSVMLIKDGLIGPLMDRDSLLLPNESYNFMKFTDLSLLSDSVFVDVYGLVVGISRYYRVCPLSTSTIGKTYVFRFIEVLDMRSGLRHQVEVFINDQVEAHEDLNLNDKVVFTCLRAVNRHSSAIHCKLSYFSTTQSTEMFSVRGGFAGNEDLLRYASKPILNKLRESEARIKQQRSTPPITWIGGTNWHSWACLKEDNIKDIFKGNLNFGGTEVKEVLNSMALYECKSFGFNGTVASVECCTVQEIRLMYIVSDMNPTEEVTQLVEPIFEILNLEEALHDVEYVGAKQANILTFPVEGLTKAADTIRDSFSFPPTNILEALRRNDAREDRTITSDSFVCNRYLRVLLLSKDKKCAVWSFFIPPPPLVAEARHKTMLNLLQLEYEVDGRNGGFSAHSRFELSDAWFDELVDTALEVLNRDLTFSLQAYRHCSKEPEITFCYAITPPAQPSNETDTDK